MALDLLTDHSQYIVGELQFMFYSSDEIRKLSVKEILNPQTFDDAQHSSLGGLYDPALGPLEHSEQCTTCSLGRMYCPGHMGHIELPVPVYHPLFFDTIYTLLRSSCLECLHIAVDKGLEHLFINQSKLLDKGCYTAFGQLEDIYHHTKNKSFEELKDSLDKFTEDALRDKTALFKDHLTRNRKELRNSSVKKFIKQFGQSTKKCPNCKGFKKPLRKDQKAKIVVVATAKVLKSDKKSETKGNENEEDPDDNSQKGNFTFSADVILLTPSKVKEIFRKLWTSHAEMLKRLYPFLAVSTIEFPTDSFFLDSLAVPPNRYRPISEMKDMKFEHTKTAIYLCFFISSPEHKVLKISEMKDMKFEHTQTANLHKVLVSCVSLREILNKGNEESVEDISNLKLQKKTYLAKLGDAMVQLQRDVNMVMDKASDGTVKDAQPGIRQEYKDIYDLSMTEPVYELLESKEGLFRKNIMGKRVNHACRSVISPDPNISTNEIGIPEVFALELTYPQPVTPWNVHELRRAVINGPKKHPGAVSVTNENGIEIMLDPKNKTRREAIAKQLLTPSPTSSRIAVVGKKTVHRHLKNGDMLLLNRQPTLHKPSIQGHMKKRKMSVGIIFSSPEHEVLKARVLKGEKTMRMNYMNCKAYNADFDGDEMSAHFPQSELCRSEAYHITSTDFQYLGPKDGTPLAGLMQDHIVSGVHLSIKGKFFCKEDYCSLVNSAVFDKQEAIKILPPAILKPYRSYTGKQIVSTVLLNVIPEDAVKLTFNGKAKIPEKSWINTDVKQETPSHMGESDVVIRGGELLVGIFDKQHLGATSYGLIHCVNELYGGRVAGRLLTCFGRLFLHFLKFRGFTLGIEDILVKDPANEERKKIIKKSCKVGPTAAKKALDLPENTGKTELLKTLKNAHFDKDDRRMRELDLSMRGQTNEIQNSIATTIMPHGLIQQFPANNLQLMVKSGSKGSLVNTMQISCLLGQIELEGKRPPIMLSGKSLPSFAAYDVSPRAGGFVSDRFLTGVRPQEYFFHCMAGREGLVDTAVKTSRSGYLQRCIIKHLEGIKVHYDYTVRDADNSIVQFHYGEDALDVSKASFLNTKQLPFLAENSGALKGNIPLKDDDYKLIRKTQKTIDDWGTNSKKIRRSGFLHFCSEIEDSPHTETEMQGRENKDVAICERWSKLRNKKRKKFSKNCKIPDPLLSTFWPYQRRVFPEKQLQLFRDFIHKQYDKDDEQMSEDFLDLMDTKMKHSLAEPGEAVGLLCAQSIGEPSTQMTLNTFHFAGRNEMNMTLGIPRLREILMTGSKMIKTPSIDVPVFPGGEAKKSVKALQKWLNKVHLSDVLEVAEIETWLSLKGERARVFHVTFKFLPYECYKQSCCVTPKFILKCMEKKFFKDLVATILYNMSKLSEARDMTSKKEKKTKEKDNDDDTSAGVDKDFVSDDLQLGNNDDGDDESDDSGSDGDDYTKKLGKKHADEKEYEDDEVLDDTGVAVEDEDVDPGMLDENFESNKLESDDEDMDEGDLEETLIRMEELKSKDKENDLLRVNNVLQIAKEIVGYKYDAKNCRSCELTLKFPLHDNQLDISGIIKKLAIKTVLHQVPGISKCYLGEEQGDRGKEFRLKTEGINVGEICKHSKLLDLDRLYCNNIHTVENTHGIEAARNVIIMEMQRVFGAYGIDVDYRHLSLLSDYMTFEGTYKPFTRRTMASNASPLQRMSYETSMTFLIDACINAEVDDLSSPSSQITVGKNISFGTGAIDMMVPLTL